MRLPTGCVALAGEEVILNLVRALVSIRLKTYGCCVGHLDGNRHLHPWVSYATSFRTKIIALERMLELYNKNHLITWGMRYGMLSPYPFVDDRVDIMTNCCQDNRRQVTEEQLRAYQATVPALAEFIFMHRGDEGIVDLVLMDIIPSRV
ncbi:MAG: hypothetical protein ABIG95_04095 [Candidatus Woesearchaeota archaeon]